MNAILIIALVVCLYLPAAMLVGHRLRRMRLAYPTAESLAAGVPAGVSAGSDVKGSEARTYGRGMSDILTESGPAVGRMMRQHTSQPVPA